MTTSKTELSAMIKQQSKEIKDGLKKVLTVPESINNTKEYLLATDVAKLMAMRIKNAETACKFLTDPLKSEAKEIAAKFSEIILPAEKILNEIKEKMKVFFVAEQARKDEEQRLLEENAIAGAKDSDQSVSVPVVNDIKTQRGSLGTSTMRTLKKWRVINIDAVPKHYFMLDDVKINMTMRSGTTIPGIEFYEDITPVIR